MNETEEVLQQLIDIRLPPTPDASPLSLQLIAVLILFAILLLLIIDFIYRAPRKAQNKHHLSELETIRQQIENQSPVETDKKLIDLSELVRRFVVESQPENQRDTISKLRGRKWQGFLDKTFATTFFTESEGRVFGKLLYTNNASQVFNMDLTGDDPEHIRTELIEFCNCLDRLFRRYNKRRTWRTYPETNAYSIDHALDAANEQR